MSGITFNADADAQEASTFKAERLDTTLPGEELAKSPLKVSVYNDGEVPGQNDPEPVADQPEEPAPELEPESIPEPEEEPVSSPEKRHRIKSRNPAEKAIKKLYAENKDLEAQYAANLFQLERQYAQTLHQAEKEKNESRERVKQLEERNLAITEERLKDALIEAKQADDPELETELQIALSKLHAERNSKSLREQTLRDIEEKIPEAQPYRPNPYELDEYTQSQPEAESQGDPMQETFAEWYEDNPWLKHPSLEKEAADMIDSLSKTLYMEGQENLVGTRAFFDVIGEAVKGKYKAGQTQTAPARSTGQPRQPARHPTSVVAPVDAYRRHGVQVGSDGKVHVNLQEKEKAFAISQGKYKGKNGQLYSPADSLEEYSRNKVKLAEHDRLRAQEIKDHPNRTYF